MEWPDESELDLRSFCSAADPIVDLGTSGVWMEFQAPAAHKPHLVSKPLEEIHSNQTAMETKKPRKKANCCPELEARANWKLLQLHFCIKMATISRLSKPKCTFDAMGAKMGRHLKKITNVAEISRSELPMERR